MERIKVFIMPVITLIGYNLSFAIADKFLDGLQYHSEKFRFIFLFLALVDALPRCLIAHFWNYERARYPHWKGLDNPQAITDACVLFGSLFLFSFLNAKNDFQSDTGDTINRTIFIVMIVKIILSYVFFNFISNEVKKEEAEKIEKLRKEEEKRRKELEEQSRLQSELARREREAELARQRQIEAQQRERERLAAEARERERLEKKEKNRQVDQAGEIMLMHNNRVTHYEKLRTEARKAPEKANTLIRQIQRITVEESLQVSSRWEIIISQLDEIGMPETLELAEGLKVLKTSVVKVFVAPWQTIYVQIEELKVPLQNEVQNINRREKTEQGKLAKSYQRVETMWTYPERYSSSTIKSNNEREVAEFNYQLKKLKEQTPQTPVEKLNSCERSILELKRLFPSRLKECNTNFDTLMQEWVRTPSTLHAGFIGTRSVMWQELETHFLAIGTSGQGKSMFWEMFFAPWFYAITRRVRGNEGSPLRMFIYDVDATILPICEGTGIPKEARFFMNPYDARGEDFGFVGWATGKDILTPDDIRSFTEVLFDNQYADDQGETSNHFAKQAKPMMQSVIAYLQGKCGQNWDLHDVMCIIFDYEKLMGVLKNATFPNEHVYRMVFDRVEHGQDSLSTLWGQLGDLREIAAIWHTRQRKASIREWLVTSGVFTVSSMGGNSEAFKRLNQAFIKLYSNIVLNELPEAPINTAFIVDEMVRLWSLPGVVDLFTNARKKGVICGGALQSIQEAQKKLGEGSFDSIVGQCKFLAMLGTNSQHTAEFFSGRCGEDEIDEYMVDVSKGTSEQSSQNFTQNRNMSATGTRSDSKQQGTSTGTNYSNTETSGENWGSGSNWSDSWGSGGSGGSKGGNDYSGGFESSATTEGTSSGESTSETHGTSIAYQEGLGAAYSEGINQGSNQTVTVRQQRRNKKRIPYTFWLDIPMTTKATGLTGVIEAPDLITKKPVREIVTIPPEALRTLRPARSKTPGFVKRVNYSVIKPSNIATNENSW